MESQPATTEQPLFELRGVGYEQEATNILADVSWEVLPGQHWALLGPNGSGKSTLLKIATGYLWHTSGQILRQGRELTDLGALRRHIGWISADIVGLIPPVEPAIETVVSGKFAQFGLRRLPSIVPTTHDFQRAAAELERLQCSHLAAKRFGVLSQGERQQVLVARTRMAGSTVLVLDEPCAGMDPGVRERFLAWLAERLLDASFPTLLLATHHLEEIVPGTSHALLMQAGRIHRSGPIDEVLDHDAIEAAYDVRLTRIEHSGGRRWPIWGPRTVE